MLALFFDYPTTLAFSFQDPATITAEGLINLHHDIMFYLIFILIFVISFLYDTLSFSLFREDSWSHSIALKEEKKLFDYLDFYNLRVFTFYEVWKQIPKARFLRESEEWDKAVHSDAELMQLFITVVYLIVFHIVFYGFFFTLFLTLSFFVLLYIGYYKGFWHFCQYLYSMFYLDIYLANKWRHDNFFFYYSSFDGKFYINQDNINHHSNLEVIWTLIPTFILCFIAYPSIKLLYAVDEASFSPLTVKIIGHQWYWSYEYGKNVMAKDSMASLDSNILSFDSYMIPYDSLEKGHIRLLSCDNALVLPVWVNIRLLVTSEDVIHSWAVPSLGVKVDAIPGRLNQNFIYIKRPGLFFGQCSEICGTNHGFMPINVNACYPDVYAFWYLNMANQTNEVIYKNSKILEI